MILEGDCLAVLRGMEPDSVQCVVTSPPYWGLRDYGTATWDGGEPGCEHVAGPAVSGSSTLGGGKQPDVAMPFRGDCGKCGAVRRDQQLGLEATPDAYVERMVEVFREVRRVLRPDGTVWLNLGDSYASSGPAGGAGKQWTNIGSTDVPVRTAPPGLKPKDLCGIPWHVAFALQADGWWLRAEVIWAKPNPMPESVTDRPTRSHESVFLLTKSARYFYDADAVREADVAGHKSGNGYARVDTFNVGYRLSYGGRGQDEQWLPGGGRNLRDVWNIATEPFPEAHFATFPKALAEPCIKAGCPVDGTVLDPFAGSGTTGVVASMLGRSFVGIELNPTYAEMARRRIANWRREYATTPAPKVLNGQSDLFDLSESLR